MFTVSITSYTVVVSHAVSCVSEVAAFFNVCEQLYNFFRRPNINSLYSGDSLKRVLDQRWEGQFAAARTLDKSMEDVVEVLRMCDLKSGETGVIATGLLKRVTGVQFRFLAKCMPTLLEKLDVPNKALQPCKASFEDALQLIAETKQMICDMKTVESFDLFWVQLTEVSNS
jgi:hypothetical protein